MIKIIDKRSNKLKENIYDQMEILFNYYPEHLREDIKEIYETLKHELFHAKIFSKFKPTYIKIKINVNTKRKKVEGICTARFHRENRFWIIFFLKVSLCYIISSIYDLIDIIFSIITFHIDRKRKIIRNIQPKIHKIRINYEISGHKS